MPSRRTRIAVAVAAAAVAVLLLLPGPPHDRSETTTQDTRASLTGPTLQSVPPPATLQDARAPADPQPVPIREGGGPGNASVSSLAPLADVAFVGCVTGTRCAWNEDASLILTYVTVDVGEVLLGEPGATLTLRELGGTVDGITLSTSVQPYFAEGQTVLVMAARNEGGADAGTYSSIGGSAGAFTIVEDPRTGRRTAWRAIGGTPQSAPLDQIMSTIRRGRG